MKLPVNVHKSGLSRGVKNPQTFFQMSPMDLRSASLHFINYVLISLKRTDGPRATGLAADLK